MKNREIRNNELLAIHQDFLESYYTAQDRIFCTDFTMQEGEDRPWFAPYRKEEGVVTIPVQGSLMNFSESFTIPGVATSYEYITDTFLEAMEDPEVIEIILDIDSPGGMVQGAFETLAVMGSYKKKKVTARTKGYATSAAYLMAIGADEIIAQESAQVGSIGVLLIHQSYKAAMEKQGIETTIMRSGKYKAEMNPFEDLSEETTERLQASVDRSAKKFAQVVASRRNMTVEAVLSLEAASMSAEEGKELGLVDKISLVNDRLMAYNDKNQKKETLTMSESAAQQPQVDLVAIQREAAAAAQTRIQGILSGPEAEGREELAKSIAFSTDLTVDQAMSLLKAAPKTEAKGQDFEQLMSSTPNPEVGAGQGEQGKTEQVLDAKAWVKILFNKGV